MISEIIVLYKPEQIDVVLARFGKKKLLNREEVEIFTLDYEVEISLKKQGIPYKSLEEYLSPDCFSDLIEVSTQYLMKWLGAPEMAFFQHREIGIGEAIQQHVQHCIKGILYYLGLFNIVFNAYPKLNLLWIPYPEPSIVPAYSASQFFSRIPIKVGELLGKERAVTVSGIPYGCVSRRQSSFLEIQRKLKAILRRFLFRFINFSVNIIQPPQKLKILAIEKWCDIEPFISKMNNIELAILQLEKISDAKWQAWKKKIKFYHTDDFLTPKIKKIAQDKKNQFISEWQALGKTPKFSEFFYYNNISFWPILKQLFDDIVNYWAETIVCQIECIDKILSRFSPDWVLLRGTSKPKFYITAKLARQHRILSMELQHSTILGAEKAMTLFLPVDYFAAYGKLTTELFSDYPKYASQHIAEVGSPRFDSHLRRSKGENQSLKDLRSRLKIDPSRLVILLIPPPIFGEFDGCYFTSYDLVKLFQTLAALQREAVGLQIIVKLRIHSNVRKFFEIAAKECFSSDMVIARYESLESLLQLSDIVVSAYKSTSVLEAMIMGKPVVLFPFKDGLGRYGIFEKEGAIRVANSYDELFSHALALIRDKKARERLSQNATTFLEKYYRFDGKSSDRIIELLKTKI